VSLTLYHHHRIDRQLCDANSLHSGLSSFFSPFWFVVFLLSSGAYTRHTILKLSRRGDFLSLPSFSADLLPIMSQNCVRSTLRRSSAGWSRLELARSHCLDIALTSHHRPCPTANVSFLTSVLCMSFAHMCDYAFRSLCSIRLPCCTTNSLRNTWL
jgi:hypothetical protein